MKPDEIPEGLTADQLLIATNHSLQQLHECVDGRMDAVEAVLKNLIEAKKIERAQTLKDVQTERHRARNEETHLQAQIAKLGKAVDGLKAMPDDLVVLKVDTVQLKGDLTLLKRALGADVDKPKRSVAAMSQSTLAVWGGAGLTALIGGPTLVREGMIVGHAWIEALLNIASIH